MISPEEFVKRCELATAYRQASAEKRRLWMRELVALCSLTEHTLRQHYPNTGHVEISNPHGEIVYSGTVEDALHQLVEPQPK